MCSTFFSFARSQIFFGDFSFGGWFPLFPQPSQIIALQKSDHQLASGSL